MTSPLVDPVSVAVPPSKPVLERENSVPAGRDLEIYEEVVIARRSQRNVAAEYGVSQPRVNQILQVVAAWLADTTPGFAADLTPRQKLRLAHYNAEQHLTHHQQCLMQAWRNSQGQEKQSRTLIEPGVRRTVETERKSFGNPRYLRESGRVALALLKLAEWSPKEQQRQASSQPPPKEDLSLSAQKTAEPKSNGCVTSAATLVETTPCAAAGPNPKPAKSAPREVKNPLSLGSGPLVPKHTPSLSQRPKSDRVAGRGPLDDDLREELTAKRKAFFGRGGPAIPLPLMTANS